MSEGIPDVTHKVATNCGGEPACGVGELYIILVALLGLGVLLKTVRVGVMNIDQ